jgi:hypothetical protein
VRDLFKLRPTDLVIFERVQPVRSEPAEASVPLPPAASGGTQEFTLEEVEAWIQKECPHYVDARTHAMLRAYARLLSLSPAPTGAEDALFVKPRLTELVEQIEGTNICGGALDAQDEALLLRDALAYIAQLEAMTPSVSADRKERTWMATVFRCDRCKDVQDEPLTAIALPCGLNNDEETFELCERCISDLARLVKEKPARAMKGERAR